MVSFSREHLLIQQRQFCFFSLSWTCCVLAFGTSATWLGAAVIRPVPLTAGSKPADYLITYAGPPSSQPAHVQLLLLRRQLQKASVSPSAGSQI